MDPYSTGRRFKSLADLSVEIGSLRLKNPVLTASGTFGYGKEFEGFLNLNELGGIVTKSITLRPWVGHPPPRIVETPAGMLNSIGLENVGVERFVREKLPFFQSLQTAVVVSIAGTSPEEYREVIRYLEPQPGIDAYEINLSCPNVKEGGWIFGRDARQVFSLTTSLRRETQRTLIVKLTPNVSEVGPLARAAEEAGADAISLINTLIGMAVDVETRRPVLGGITGGLSGPAIKPVALAKVYEARQAVKIPVIGVGGIMNYRDVLEFLITGATAVQIGTANFVQPDITAQIIRDLESYCWDKGIARISELIGTLKVA